MKKKQVEMGGDLRRRAEERVGPPDGRTGGGNPQDDRRAVHELQVHQVELEMQNEELLRVRAEQEATLAQYTELYDFAPVGYLSLGADGVVRKANLTAAGFLRVERARLVGTPLRSFLEVVAQPGFDAFLAGVLDRRIKDGCELEFRPAGADPVHVQLDAVATADGQECRAALVDVTEKKRLQARWLQSQKLEAIGRLAGGIAHDFNNILGGMTLALNLAQEEAPAGTPGLREALEDALAMVDRATVLTSQLLSFGRRQVMVTSRVELNSVVDDFSRVLGKLLRDDIALVVDKSPAALFTEANRVMLQQVLMNLCINARDAIKGAGQLVIRTREAVVDRDDAPRGGPPVRPGRYACLTVQDTGCGIAPAHLDHVFEPFFTTKEVGKGTGLGLAAVDGIVSQHKGHVEVQSVVGRGTSFQVFLPLATTSRAQVAPHGRLAGPTRAGVRVLLVEDDLMVRVTALRCLRRLGHEVLAAEDADMAMQVWEREAGRFQLLLTDMVMPGPTSGLDLCRRCRELAPDLGVILMSGYSMDLVQGLMRPEDRVVFLAKPFDLSALVAALSDCLGDKVARPVS
jgi:signal transduction histidine kinase/ActR/RegA family two-component response regulator